MWLCRSLVIWTMTFGLAGPALHPQTAYERAPRTADHRLIVDNLLIGCTTAPDPQGEVMRSYGGNHHHDAQQWVSFDLDPGLRPDLCGRVQALEQQVARINRMVYVEHFNEPGQRACWNYQGELVRKLSKLMEPGATLYLDLYPRTPVVAMAQELPAGYVDWRHNHYGLSPHGLTPEGRRAYLLEAAAHNLDLLLHDRNLDALEPLTNLFYRRALAGDILAFIHKAGFTEVHLVKNKAKPFNGRVGEDLIVATKRHLSDEFIGKD